MQDFITTFFKNLGIELSSVEVSEKPEDFQIKVETPDSALLIGMHGKNLEAFQHLLGRMVERKTGVFTRVHLEVNDYMKSKDDRLFGILDMKISFAQSIGKGVKVQNLTSYERKKAHDYISGKNIVGLSTKSEGEGVDRVLIITYTGEIIKPSVNKVAPAKKPTRIEIDLAEDGVGI